MIKAIATDCFGVLYNDILKDMLRRHDVSSPEILAACFEAAEVSDRGDFPLHEFFKRLSHLTGIPLDIVKQEMADLPHFNVGFVEILKRLKPDYKLAMITDADTALIAPFLDHRHVRDIFDIIVTSSEAKITKPNKQIFEILVNKLHVEPSEVVFIDNSAKNTEAAAALGMATILYTTNELLEEQLHTLLSSPAMN